MKKRLAAVITALAFLGALLIQGGLAVPEIENLSDAVCVGAGEMIYVAGYGPTSEGVYGIGDGGEILEYRAYGPSEWGGKRQVIELCADENGLYQVMEIRNAGNRQLQGYRLLGTDLESGEMFLQVEIGPEVFSAVTDLAVEDGKPIVSGITGDGQHLAGYLAGEDEGEELTLLYLQPVLAGDKAADSLYFGKTIFLRTETGRIGKYTDYGYVDIRQEERPAEGNFLIRGEQGVLSYEKDLGRALPVSRGAAAGFGIPDNVTARAGYLEADGRFLFLGTRRDGARVFCYQMGDSCLEYQSLVPSLGLRFRFSIPYLPRTIGGTAVVWLVLLGVWWIYGKSGKISLKLSFTCFAAAFFLMMWWLWLLKSGGHSKAQLRLLFATGGITSGLLAALLFVWVEYITMPLRNLKRYMDRISSGNYQTQKKVRSNDEVSAVWFSVTGLCQSLEEQRYRGRQLIKSYYRFVPRDINRVFEKDSIVELEAGEVRKVEGMVGLISVLNREEIRENLRDEEYMEMIKSLFQLITETVENHGGILASGEFDLSGIKVLFLGETDEAIAFGLDLLARCRERSRNGCENPELFFLIHRTGYLYGLAGDGEQSLPFFVSGEMEVLSAKAREFHGTGAGMVMTGEALEGASEKPENRYIGYFQLPDGGTRCELYEVFGACPEPVRVAKRQLAEKWKEGLELYYKNDFYLARNIFLAVVKECPQDGIAKWYLFASEHYFNSGVEDGVDYSLFKVFEETGGGHGFPV